ncbi:MAG: hypothetical protein HY209_04925 [Candidatus Omnitrophica bacterium]|nr:hypothetical protein [Candidatus Omnitrophota bacterium]
MRFELAVIQIFFFLVVILICLYLRRKTDNLYIELLKHQADKRNGRLKNFFFQDYPKLELSFEGIPITVRTNRRYRGCCENTIFTCRLPGPSTNQLDVLTGPPTFAKAYAQLPPLKSNAEFYDTFSVRPFEHEHTEKFLTPEIQKIFMELYDLQPALSIYNNNFSLTIYKILRDDLLFDKWLDASFKLLSNMKEF